MKIERIIFVFKIEEDKLFSEIDANNINLSIIKKLYNEREDDPYFYRPLKIEQTQYDILAEYVPELKKYHYSKFESYLEAVTVD